MDEIIESISKALESISAEIKAQRGWHRTALLLAEKKDLYRALKIVKAVKRDAEENKENISDNIIDLLEKAESLKQENSQNINREVGK